MDGSLNTMIGKTLVNRALMANALCAVAEGEFHSGRRLGAIETIRSIRALLADIDIILDGDTSHLPRYQLRECAELLAGIDDRVAAIERDLGPSTIH